MDSCMKAREIHASIRFGCRSPGYILHVYAWCRRRWDLRQLQQAAIMIAESVGEFRKTRHPRNIQFNEVLEICFSGARHMRFSGILDLWSLGVANMRFSGILGLRNFGVANMRLSGITNLRSLGVMNLRKAGISNQRSHELRRVEIRESAKSLFWKSRTENSRTGKKQSQSCRPKKSGFEVWTSGRLVNIWDEKDILVCVHIRNILRARGCFRNVKVPSSPYKRGAWGHV
jgi:hypothetical protein